MNQQDKFVYKINIKSISDVISFTKTAVSCRYDVSLVNGKHKLNAKSYLGVALARASWDEIYVEAEVDCYFDFEKFIT